MSILVAAILLTLATIALVAAVKLRRRQSGPPIEERLRQVSQQASKRLMLRRPAHSDRAFYLELAQDPTAAEANGWLPHERQVVRSRFDEPDKFAQLQLSELVAVEIDHDVPVATATLGSRTTETGPVRTIGVQVHPKARRNGYGRETMAAAILFLQQDPLPIVVGTRATNRGMRRIMEQLGYKPVDEDTPYLAPNGESYPALWYSCGADTHPPTQLFG